jgi:hypothetical protein
MGTKRDLFNPAPHAWQRFCFLLARMGVPGYFDEMDEQEEPKRPGNYRRNFATAELPEKKAKTIGASRMDARHEHLDSMLDNE